MGKYTTNRLHHHVKWGIEHAHPHEHLDNIDCATASAHNHHLTAEDATNMVLGKRHRIRNGKPTVDEGDSSNNDESITIVREAPQTLARYFGEVTVSSYDGSYYIVIDPKEEPKALSVAEVIADYLSMTGREFNDKYPVGSKVETE